MKIVFHIVLKKRFYKEYIQQAFQVKMLLEAKSKGKNILHQYPTRFVYLEQNEILAQKYCF